MNVQNCKDNNFQNIKIFKKYKKKNSFDFQTFKHYSATSVERFKRGAVTPNKCVI